MDDATKFGHELAERMVCLIRDQGTDAATTTQLFLDEVGERFRAMNAAGESGTVIAAWVEAVAGAYERRIEELTR
jgi:hypothetical protein